MTTKKMDRKLKNIVIILLTLFAAVIFFFVDLYFDGKFFSFIADNSLFKIVTIFFTLGGLVGLFLPFSLRQDVSTADISEISKQTYEQKKQTDETNERIRKQSKF